MERLTKYQNDLIRNKAINILRRLSDKNNLSGDELSVIGAFLVLERVENNTLKKYEDSGIEPEDIPLVKNLNNKRGIKYVRIFLQPIQQTIKRGI